MSTRRFKMVPNANQSSWVDKPQEFGIIKGLHLEGLEFPSKIKKNAPIPLEPTFSGKTNIENYHPQQPFTEPQKDPRKESIKNPTKQSVKQSSKRSSSSSYSHSKRSASLHDEYDDNEDDEDFLNKFGDDTASKKSSPPKIKKEPIPKYIPVPNIQIESNVDAKPQEEDPTEKYIRDEVERRTNIAALKKAKLSGIDVGEIDDDMTLEATRILRQIADKQVAHNSSVSMNKFALMGIFFGADQGLNWWTDKMKGYFEFQMKVMHIYDPYLEAIGENNINMIFQDLDPSFKLIGVAVASTGAFYVFQNYVGEDKVKGAKLIQAFFPGAGDIIEDITSASKEVKNDKKEEPKEEKSTSEKKPKKRRGPSYKAEDIEKV